MQFLSYFITLSLLGPLVSLAVDSKNKDLLTNRVTSSVRCDDVTFFSSDVIQKEATEACSGVERKFRCDNLVGCFQVMFTISFSNLKVYQGSYFKSIGFTNSRAPNLHYGKTFFEWKLPENILYRNRNHYFIIISISAESEKCTYEGLVKRSKQKEKLCDDERLDLERGPPLDKFSESPSRRLLDGMACKA
ncbi:hypothetical protein GcM3_215033 [Golovinomyces cichoracearum]|uniref:Secreted effector protein n=1 Tax=Golovinomyces cichoracearum TaxID=62708 RepID=A0A420H8U5_9PEZI|nr:hypothetical protein GcM3_215033 [Golovinomyces cichoracearum]